MKLFSSKCKYCDIFRTSPNHLNSIHNINISNFSIESVYSLWKTEKLNWIKITKNRQQLIQKGEEFFKKYLDDFKKHTVCK